jgi:hypothetical protein
MSVDAATPQASITAANTNVALATRKGRSRFLIGLANAIRH